MFLVNSYLGLFTAARSRGRTFSLTYGAILQSSLTAVWLARLRLLAPATCVRSRYGPPVGLNASGFSWRLVSRLRTRRLRLSSPLGPRYWRVAYARHQFPSGRALPIARFHLRSPSPPRPTDGLLTIKMSSIAYASRPRLRSRLSQGGRTLPWRPWPYGGVDSHHPTLLTPAYSLRRPPGALTVTLRRCGERSPTTARLNLAIRSFGGALESR